MNIDQILSARSWAALGVDKTKDELRKLQREFHPDINKDPRATGVFIKLVELFEGSDYELRFADGTRQDGHTIQWEPKHGFADLVSRNYQRLSTLASQASDGRFFPKAKSKTDSIVSYGEGWWFASEFDRFDSRTAVWIAKRGVAAIIQAADIGLFHNDINPNTIVLKPSEHGLMLDGWWGGTKSGEDLIVAPFYPLPAKFKGGSKPDEGLQISQLCNFILENADTDKKLTEVFKRGKFGNAKGREFFMELDKTAKLVYGTNKWHELVVPKSPMI